MTLLNRFIGCLSFFLPRHNSSRQYSKGNNASSIQEEFIQRPPEDTGVEEQASEDSLVKMEILPDFSTVAEPLMIQVEEPEYQTLHAGVKIFPCSSTTVAKPLLIQVAPQHPLPDEVETWPSFSTVAEQLMVQFEEPDEGKTLAHSSTKVVEPLMDQEAPWHLSPPAEEEILPSLSTVAEPPMVQMAPAEVEQEHPPERRGRSRTKKKRNTDSSTIKRPTSPPAKPKLAWMDNPAQNTKAEEEMINKERELEDKTPVKQETVCVEILEVDMKQERRMKKDRKIEYATPPPAKPKLAWMETDSTEVAHMKKRQEEKRRPERQANKTEDTKTEQAANITPPPVKGNKMHVGLQEPECSGKISQQSSRRQKGLLFIYKLAEKKVTAEKEKKKIRKDEKLQRQLLYKKYVNDPSMKHLLINKHNSFIKS